MEAHRVGLVTLLALGAVAVAGSATAGIAGMGVHGTGLPVWDLGAILPLLLICAYAWLTRPDHPTAQRMAVVASLFALQSAFAPPVSSTPEGVTIPSDVVTLGREQLWVSYLGFHVLNVAMMVTLAWLLALYPSGQLETGTERRLLRPLWGAMALPLVVLVARPVLLPPPYEAGTGTEPSPFFVPSLEPIGGAAAGVLRGVDLVALLGLGLLIARYRRSGVQFRQRIRWLLLPVAVGLAMELVANFVQGGFADTQAVPVVPAFGLGLLLGLREQRIVPLDVVLRRSLVYGLLWLLIIGAYVGIAAGLGLAVSERFPVVVAILLTIGVTLAFQPARRWLEGLADRWVFGTRLGRYEALTRLGRLLEEAFDLDALLPHLARTVRMTLGLAWARVELVDEPGAPARATAVDGAPPDGAGPALTVPVELAGEHLGEIACGPKVRGGLGDTDRAVLEDLARQSALAIRNVRLAAQLADRVQELRHRTDQLAESRRRLVRAQEAERRRIERDLHDGIQQDLVALIGEVGRARTHLDGTAPQTVPMLGSLQEELARVLQDLRELAHGIHPQLLADRGLLAAVEVRARRCPVPVVVRAGGDLRTARFPVEVEGAAYFTVCEALANMLKHAHATAAEIRLDHADGRLLVDVSDDGHGMHADPEPGGMEGHGLSNLAERLGALDGTLQVTGHDDGGTLLHAELPATRVYEPSDA